MMQILCKSYRGKYLTEDEILAELFMDTLSEIPDNYDSDSCITTYKQNRNVHLVACDSEQKN